VKSIGGIAAVAIALAAGDARASELQDATHEYFAGEKNSGYLWGSVGLVAIGSGAFLLTRKTDITRGAAYPLIGVGAIQAILAGALLLGTDARVRKLDEQYVQNPRVFRDDELTRIKGVNRTFLILEIVEAVLIAGGTTLAIASKSDTWRGVGIGLAIQGAAMLSLDGLAHARAGRYERALEAVTFSGSF
jgi:hypothetical protein